MDTLQAHSAEQPALVKTESLAEASAEQPADQDILMADTPGASTPTASKASVPPRISTPTPTPSRTPAPFPQPRNGTPATSTAPVIAIPAKTAPNGGQCRQYLNEKITAVLLDGMKRVASEQPEDPLRMLGEFLLAKSKELEE